MSTHSAGFASGSDGVTNRVEVIDERGNLAQQNSTATPTVALNRQRVCKKVALTATDAGGGILTWQNPETASIMIDKILVNVTTKSTAACTAHFGTTPTSGTTSSDNLITSVDIGTAVILADNFDNKGANGKSKQLLATGKWVTGSMATGAAAGTVGFAYIYYTVL